jgi:predicted DNA-binding transcriptional regulator AlpA
VRKIVRPRQCAELLGMGFSTFDLARREDPDFKILEPPIPIGPRAIGFFEDDVLRLQLLKASRGAGVSDADRKRWIEDRLIEALARSEQVSECRARLEVPRRRGRGRKVEAA